MRHAVAAAILVLLIGSPAFASNGQAGGNTGSSAQTGSSTSGDAIGGPSSGVSWSGDVRVRMTNRSGVASEAVGPADPANVSISNVTSGPTSLESGAAAGGNASSLFVGLGVDTTTNVLADLLAARLR